MIETEMEEFMCVQCGHCCLNLHDAYETSVPESDVIRWEQENRSDILEWVKSFYGINDVWIDPETGEFANRCPWLRSLPKEKKYFCGIHETKPEYCQNFPKSKQHGLKCGCKGFTAEQY